MPHHSAAATRPNQSIGRHAANDNSGAPTTNGAFDPLLTEALLHFATHGLRAAEAALDAAQDAQARGDAQAKRRWLAITGLFDRRRAEAVAARDNPPR